MKAALARLLRRFADRCAPVDWAPAPDDGELRVSEPFRQHSVDEDEDRKILTERCYDTAVELCKSNVEGFIILLMRPAEAGDGSSDIVVRCAVPDLAWEGFTETMQRVILFRQEHGDSEVS